MKPSCVLVAALPLRPSLFDFGSVGEEEWIGKSGSRFVLRCPLGSKVVKASREWISVHYYAVADCIQRRTLPGGKHGERIDGVGGIVVGSALGNGKRSTVDDASTPSNGHRQFRFLFDAKCWSTVECDAKVALAI